MDHPIIPARPYRGAPLRFVDMCQLLDDTYAAAYPDFTVKQWQEAGQRVVYERIQQVGKARSISQTIVLQPCNTIVCAVSGIASPGQALAIVRGNVAARFQEEWVNTAYIDCAQDVYFECERARATVGGEPGLLLVGHSLGGVAVSIVRRWWREAVQGPMPWAISLGAPRPGLEKFSLKLASGFLWRFANADDWITAVPFIQDVLASTIPFPVPFMDYVLWPAEQIPGGIKLGKREVTGNITETFNNDLAAGLARTLQLVTERSGAPREHSLATYNERLTRFAADEPIENPIPVQEPPERNFIPVWPGDLVQRNGGRGPGVFRIGGRSGASTSIMGPVIIPKHYQFKAQKIGSEWWVTWQGLQIIKCTTSSSAKHARGRLNNMLRFLARRTLIYRDQFNTAWEQLLVAASNVAEGFDPVWSIE